MADRAILQALRTATSSAQQAKALDLACDRVTSTTSVPETQRLFDAIFACIGQHGLAFPVLIQRIKPVASVCTTPPQKIELLSHLLFENLVGWVGSTSSHPDALRLSRDTLLRVYLVNPASVGGVISAIESHNEPDTALLVARPLLIAVLVNAKPRHVQKLAVIQSLVRTAWSTSSTSGDPAAVHKDTPASIVASVFTRATILFPLSTDVDAWLVYRSLVASTVDLVQASSTSGISGSVFSVAHAIVRRVLFGIQNQLSVLSLLQSLLELAGAFPDAVCTSSIVFLVGQLIQHPASSSREQSLCLLFLQEVLPSGSSKSRYVYLENLVVPLVSVLSTHPKEAPPLLQLVLDTVATVPFHSASAVAEIASSFGENAAHASSFLALMASVDASELWLQSLFQQPNPEIADPSSTLLLQLGACLVDTRGRIRSLALDALDRQVQLRRVDRTVDDWRPSELKLLVSTLVVLTSYRPPSDTKSGVWLSHCFQVLASLAATTTDTMKIILRLVKRLASTPSSTGVHSLRAQALHLLLLVWKQDSRVYPQLEAMLQQDDEAQDDEDEDPEMELVRMATILEICKKDPENGVEWISEIQKSLENESVQIVAMAVRAVTLLCIADCLDYETTVKSFIIKMKKKRIGHVDNALFQQELCHFYAFGGLCGFVDSSPKYAPRVLADLWTFVDAADASVRLEAWKALNGYSLESLGLCLVDEREKLRQGRAGEDEEHDDEDKLTEEEVEQNVDSVWLALQHERDSQVRLEIQSLVQKILDVECTRLLGASGRSSTLRGHSGVASVALFTAPEHRVSAAATKELKKLLPVRQEIVQQVDAAASKSSDQWDAYLLAYEPVDATVDNKRKDKRLRMVSSQMDEMKAIIWKVLEASTASSAVPSTRDDPLQSQQRFLELLRSVNAWRSFGGKFIRAVDELATLRTPTDAPVGHTAELLSDLLDNQFQELMMATDNKSNRPQRWLVVGALLHSVTLLAVATTSPLVASVVTATRKALRDQLLQSMEELRVFHDHKYSVDVVHLLLGVELAYPADATSTTSDDVAISTVRSLLLVQNQSNQTLSSTVLLQAVAVLYVSHFTSLATCDSSTTAEAEGPGTSTSSLRHRQQLLKNGVDTVVQVLLRQPTTTTAATSVCCDAVAGEPTAPLAAATTSAATVVQWAAAMGIAQLTRCFARVNRLMWLDNLRALLLHQWASKNHGDGSQVVAVALGPVLLESVQYNRISSSNIDDFVATLIQRLQSQQQSAATTTMPCGAVVVPFMLHRMALSCGDGAAPQHVEALLSLIETSSSSDTEIASVIASNFLYGSTGVLLLDSSWMAAITLDGCEVTWEPAVVSRIIAALRARSMVQTAAVADRVESFYVVQKNKTFDVQIQSLPATSLLAKTLAFLRHGGGDGNVSQAAVLTCLAHTARHHALPFDLSSFVRRVLARTIISSKATEQEGLGVVASCLDLAGSHASCVPLLTSDLLTMDKLINYPTPLLERCVDTLSVARHRMTTGQLTTQLKHLFDALVDRSTRVNGNEEHALTAAFGKWIELISSLLLMVEPADQEKQKKNDDGHAAEVAAAVAALVLGHCMGRLPQTPSSHQSKQVLQKFATLVLAKMPSPHRDEVVERITTSSAFSGLSSRWAWWRASVLLCQLLRDGIVVSSASVLLRWLVRLDFPSLKEQEEEVDANARILDAVVADIVDAVCTTGTSSRPSTGTTKRRAPLDSNEPWILELVDAVGSTTSGSSSRTTTTSSMRRRRVLMDVVHHVVAWTALRGLEAFVLAAIIGLPRGAIQATMPAFMAQALLHANGSSATAAAAIAQRLCQLDGGLSSASTTDITTTTGGRNTILEMAKELHVITSINTGPSTKTATTARLLSSDMEVDLVTTLSCLE